MSYRLSRRNCVHIAQCFTAVKATPSKEDGWIDVTIGTWTAHVEFDVSNEQLAAFRIEANCVPTVEAAALLLGILRDANTIIRCGADLAAGPMPLESTRAKSKLRFTQVDSPVKLVAWLEQQANSK